MILVKSREGFISLWDDPAIQEAFTNSDAFKVELFIVIFVFD